MPSPCKRRNPLLKLICKIFFFFFLKWIGEFVDLQMLTQKQLGFGVAETCNHQSFLPTKPTGRQVQILQNLTSQLTLIGIVVVSLIRKQRAEWLNGFRELE